jgi:diguanylate cyclase (GGDEF)-like protein
MNDTASTVDPPLSGRWGWPGALLAWIALAAAWGAVPPARCATPPEMLFTRLGADAGVSQGAILAIAQDAQGFMWFGTEDGLDRFDGYELRHFIHQRGDAGSLPSNWIGALLRDDSGRLWIGTDGGGLVWRDEAGGQFQRPAAEDGAVRVDPYTRVRKLRMDRGGRLWIATLDAGLRVLDPVHHTVQSFRHAAASADSLAEDAVIALAEDRAGGMWVGTAGGVDRIDESSGRVEHLGERLRRAVDAAGGASGSVVGGAIRVNDLLVDAWGVLWIAMDSGLAKLDPRSSSLEVLRHRDDAPGTLPNGRVRVLLEDDARRLWIGTSAGLALLDARTGHVTTMRHDAGDSSSLPDSNVTSLFQDRGGLLWVGTKSGGVARWNPRSWSFGHHRFSDEGSLGVTSFAVDHRGVLWVGSFGAGVAAVDPQSGVVTRLRSDSKSPLALRDDTIMAVVSDQQDRLWLGTMSKGIEMIDAARGRITHFDAVPEVASSLPAPGVMSLMQDRRGQIWVGTFGGGLARLDPESGRVVRFAHGREDDSGLAGDRATALAEDGAGLIWIGTEGGGLNVLNPATGRFAHFAHDPANAASLSANTVYSLHVDPQGAVWVGTRGGGLDRVIGRPFGTDAVHFDNLSESEGLPNSTVYGIESDADGGLWLSTNRGLAVVNPVDHRVRGFRRSHGLQGDEFNFGAHYRAADGTLYFGGSNGYNAFRPDRLELNDRPPAVVLTHVLKSNRAVSPAPELLRTLDLGYRDSVLTFQFAALDYAGPAENRYAYRLKGFDADWVDADGARQATYTNLAGGNYEFQVRAANNDGLWTVTPAALRVHVAPPPWATWWARTAMGGVLLAVVFFVWLGQQRRIQREAAYAQRLKMEVDARTAELAERNRDMEVANEQLRAASYSDTLTGLGNRRRLHASMSAWLSGSTLDARARAVLMVIDLDCLKPINDQYGHEGGDAVLVQFAEILRSEFRAIDLIVRWGGDEFIALCMDADLESAGNLAERVRAAVSKRIFRVGGGLAVRTSCSIGFAPLPFIPGRPEVLDWEQTLGIADLALYHAKRERNTWIGWSGTERLAAEPSIPAALAADSAAQQKQGSLIVHRRPLDAEETLDRLRILVRPVTS